MRRRLLEVCGGCGALRPPGQLSAFSTQPPFRHPRVPSLSLSSFSTSASPSSSLPSSSSPSPLSAAEARALSLAQREALREAQRDRQGRGSGDEGDGPSLSVPTHSTRGSGRRGDGTRGSRLPPLLPRRGGLTALEAVEGGGGGGTVDGLTTEEAVEQLALIDELTDFLRTFRHPSTDRPSAPSAFDPTAPSTPATTIDPRDFFYARPHITQSYNHLLSNHCLHRAVDAGLAVKAAMQQRGVSLNEETFTHLVRLCGCGGEVTAEKKAALLETVDGLWAEMTAAHVQPSVRFFDALLCSLIRLGAVERALAVPELLRSNGLQPTALTYTSLLTLYRHPSVTFDAVKSFWSSLRQVERLPDVISFNAAIRAAGHYGETEFALRLFADLQHQGLHPSAVTYNSLIYACAKRPDFYLKAFDLYQTALAQQYQPDRYMMGSLLHATALQGDLSNAIRVFEQMELSRVLRDTRAYNSMLHCIANSQRRVVYNLQGNKASLTQVQRMEMADRLLIQMEATGVAVDDRTVYLALMAHTAALRLRMAEQKREELVQRYCKGEEEQQRREGRGHFDGRLWALLLSMYSRARRLDDCKRLVRQMEDLGLQPAQRSYDQLLHLCALKGESDWGAELLQQMRSRQLKPSNVAHERLFDVQQFRAWRRAQAETRKDGAVPALSAAERQRLRDRAWFGSGGLRGPTAGEQQRRRDAAGATPRTPSNMERRAAEREMKERKQKEKSLQQENL